MFSVIYFLGRIGWDNRHKRIGNKRRIEERVEERREEKRREGMNKRRKRPKKGEDKIKRRNNESNYQFHFLSAKVRTYTKLLENQQDFHGMKTV